MGTYAPVKLGMVFADFLRSLTVKFFYLSNIDEINLNNAAVISYCTSVAIVSIRRSPSCGLRALRMCCNPNPGTPQVLALSLEPLELAFNASSLCNNVVLCCDRYSIYNYSVALEIVVDSHMLSRFAYPVLLFH